MDPLTMYGIGAGVNAIGQGLMGSQEQGAKGNLHLVNPMQQQLYQYMGNQLMNGAGDYGFGNAIKQGKSQLQDFMAQRGISPDSGVYGQQMGNMVANASALAGQNRMNNLFQLMSQPLQTATITGANFLPGSTSFGIGREQQAASFDRNRNPWGSYQLG